MGRARLQHCCRSRTDAAWLAARVGGAGVKSCLYTGTVQHRRHVPVSNAFKYRLFMMYLDLAELPQVFEPYLFWSAKRAAPARFKREDYLRLDGQLDGEDSLSLDESV